MEKKRVSNFKPNAKYIAGAKWGDEGKGKIASRESEDAKLVIRATGGANAGHTIIYKDNKLALHLVPGGIVNPEAICLIGQGVAFDPIIFLQEIEDLNKINVPNVRERIKISGRAPVVFPYHKDLDGLYESIKDNPIGTTKRGIGPCYADHDNRVGMRVYDLLLPEDELAKKIDVATRVHNQLFKLYNMENCIVDPKKLAKEFHEYGQKIKEMVVNADILTSKARKNGDKIAVEGAQAYRLDKNYGDYENVTSSNCVTAGALIGGHLNHKDVKEVVMITKAYDSRVGNGPFPTELPAHIKNDVVLPYDKPFEGDIIREEGHEYGATTKRPRRVGWCDAVILRSAKDAEGADYICINHLDTLGKIGNILGNIKICVGYKYQGKEIDYYPDDMNLTHEVPTPIYKTLKGGWDISSDLRDYNKLPDLAKEFIKIVEDVAEIPVKYIGVGPKNEDLIVREEL